MNRLLWVILLFFVPRQAFSQEAFSKYYDPNSFALISLTDNLEIKFSWVLEGKAQSFMNEGLNSLLERRPHAAIANFDQVIKFNPKFWPAYYYRGVCNKNILDLNNAAMDLQKAINLNPKLFEGFIELGEIFHVTKNLSEAKQMYEKAIQLNPSSATAHYFLGTFYLSMGEKNGALTEYKKCNELDRHFPNAFFVQGVLCARSKNQEQGLSYFSQALAADSLFKPALFWRGLVFAMLNDKESSIKDWNKLVSLEPGNPFYVIMRGFMLIELEKFDEAFRDFRTVLQLDPEEDVYSGNQTIFDKQADSRSVAKYLVSTGYGLNESAFGLLKKAFCLWIGQKHGDALMAIDEAMEIQQSPAGFLLRGMIFNQRRDYGRAEDNFMLAIKSDPDIFAAHEKISLYRYNDRDWNGSLKELNEMNRLKPHSPVLTRFSGMLKSHTDYPGCIEDLHLYLKEQPGDTDVRETLEFCYNKLNNGTGSPMLLMADLDDERKAFLAAYSSQLRIRDTVSAVTILNSMSEKWPRDNVMSLLIAERYIDLHDFDRASDLLTKMF